MMIHTRLASGTAKRFGKSPLPEIDTYDTTSVFQKLIRPSRSSPPLNGGKECLPEDGIQGTDHGSAHRCDNDDKESVRATLVFRWSGVVHHLGRDHCWTGPNDRLQTSLLTGSLRFQRRDHRDSSARCRGRPNQQWNPFVHFR